MHIAVINDREDTAGGSIAAIRLVHALAGSGHQVTRICEQTSVEDPRWTTYRLPSAAATGVSLPSRIVRKVTPAHIRSSRHQRDAARRLKDVLRDVKPDVVSIQTLHLSGWSPEMLEAAAAAAPTVCTLHDMWLLTGRCMFAYQCERYVTGCNEDCPTADEYPALAPRTIPAAWKLRQDILARHSRIAAVAPSVWIGRTAATGLWRERRVFLIHYALDMQRFSPIDRRVAKETMGLNQDDRVILACASELSSPRKGIQLLIEALAGVLGQRLRVLLMGLPLRLPSDLLPYVHQIGFVSDERLRAIVFNSADVFVHPALADNAPQTVIESLCCGTPVISFPIGGLPEMVIDGRTGWLTQGVSREDLHATIIRALRDLDAGLTLREDCRRFALSRFQPSDVASHYESVFRHVLSGEPTFVPTIRSETSTSMPPMSGA